MDMSRTRHKRGCTILFTTITAYLPAFALLCLALPCCIRLPCALLLASTFVPPHALGLLYSLAFCPSLLFTDISSNRHAAARKGTLDLFSIRTLMMLATHMTPVYPFSFLRFPFLLSFSPEAHFNSPFLCFTTSLPCTIYGAR